MNISNQVCLRTVKGCMGSLQFVGFPYKVLVRSYGWLLSGFR